MKLYKKWFAIFLSLVPASPPENLAATASSSTTIAVMWDEVVRIDQNGVITMYEVMYTPLEDFDGAIMTRTTNVTDLSVLLMDLEEYVNYTISVRAFTNAGAGPYSDPVTVLTNEGGKYC